MNESSGPVRLRVTGPRVRARACTSVARMPAIRLVCILSVLLACVLFFLFHPVLARPSVSESTLEQIDFFGEVFDRIRAGYVTEPEDSALVRGAIDGMLGTLDPHSGYLTAEEYRDMQEKTTGSFAGLGIRVLMEREGPDKGLVKIIAPIDDTPAARAGLRSEDLIIAIDGEDVSGMSIDEAVSKMKGEKGTRITITVLRDRQADPFEMTLERDIIDVLPVSHRVEGDIGYVRISVFNGHTAKGLHRALDELDTQIPGGPRGLVLDVRSNPGGLFDQSVLVADAFLDGGEIVSVRGRNAHDTFRKMGSAGDRMDGKPVIVLIDGGSASASEIVAGALQDRARALLLGTRSFGKGSVQTVIPLADSRNGALRLTTARYYTPSGRSIQAMGIDPDIPVPVIYPGHAGMPVPGSEKDLEGALDAGKPLLPEERVAGEKSEPDGQDTEDTGGPAPLECDADTDCQLERALEILADTDFYLQAMQGAADSYMQQMPFSP